MQGPEGFLTSCLWQQPLPLACDQPVFLLPTGPGRVLLAPLGTLSLSPVTRDPFSTLLSLAPWPSGFRWLRVGAVQSQSTKRGRASTCVTNVTTQDGADGRPSGRGGRVAAWAVGAGVGARTPEEALTPRRPPFQGRAGTSTDTRVCVCVGPPPARQSHRLQPSPFKLEVP